MTQILIMVMNRCSGKGKYVEIMNSDKLEYGEAINIMGYRYLL